MLYFSIVGKSVVQEIILLCPTYIPWGLEKWEKKKRLESENKVYRKGHEMVG